jgi:hypothetical protein
LWQEELTIRLLQGTTWIPPRGGFADDAAIPANPHKTVEKGRQSARKLTIVPLVRTIQDAKVLVPSALLTGGNLSLLLKALAFRPMAAGNMGGC